MNLKIVEITDEKDLASFIKFQINLYEGCTQYIPPILDFEVATLSRKKNPAFDHCEAKYFLARRGDKIVGRIAGIVHKKEADTLKLIRFGWIDFVDDYEVSEALIKAVADWGKELGLTGIHGPMGFTDLDMEGMLVSGFDQLGTQVAIYNFEYYKSHMERLGFEKACDWIEARGGIPNEIPRRLKRAADMVKSRFQFYTKEFKSTKDFVKNAPEVFDILNQSYSHLYGYFPLSEKQVKYYVNLYFSFLRTDFVTIVYNKEDKPIAFAICVPSMSKAFQKAHGHLFPFGFIHVLSAFYREKNLDLLLIAAYPEYQKMGVSSVIFCELLEKFIKHKIASVATGPMLEDNWSVLNLWNDFVENRSTVEIRRRCYKLKLS